MTDSTIPAWAGASFAASDHGRDHAAARAAAKAVATADGFTIDPACGTARLGSVRLSLVWNQDRRNPIYTWKVLS